MIFKETEGRNYLVTGATSGIGLGVTKELLSQGANVFGVGRNLNKVPDEVSSNERFTFISFDLTNIEGIKIAIASALGNNTKLDGFVSSAGREETIPLSIYNAEKIKELFNLNFFSNFELLRMFGKKKLINTGASIVLVSSVMGELGQPGIAGYCSTKSALLGLVRSAALEFAPRKIRVNAISPGVVNTPMSAKFFASLADENVERIKSMHPLGIGEVSQVVPSIIFLLSDQSTWMTGQNIKIDGGYSIQ